MGKSVPWELVVAKTSSLKDLFGPKGILCGGGVGGGGGDRSLGN